MQAVPDRKIALGLMLEGLPDAAVGAGRDGLIAFVNTLAESQFGYRREDMIGRPLEMLWPPNVRARYRRNLELYWELEHPLRFSARAYGRRKDGTDFVGEMSWGIVETDQGPLLLAIGRDISERLDTEARLRRQSEQQAAVAALGERALRGVGPQELSEEAAERIRATLGVDRVAVLDGPKEIAAWGAVETSASRVSVPIHTGDEVHGALVAAAAREDAFGDEEGSFLQAVANVLAIAFSRLHTRGADPPPGTARPADRPRQPRALPRPHRARARAVRAGGQRRRRAVRRPRQLQARQRPLRPRRRRRAAGRARRPDVRRRAPGRHRRAARRGRVRRRLRGRRRAHRARPRLARRRGGGGAGRAGATPLSASIGIAFGRTGATDPGVLIGHADAAAYRAKERGSGRVEIFDEGLRQRAADRVQTASDLEGALERRELELEFQPVVALADGATVGTRRCCAGGASAGARSPRRSSSRSPRSPA